MDSGSRRGPPVLRRFGTLLLLLGCCAPSATTECSARAAAGEPPIVVAAACGDARSVRSLVAQGADVNAPNAAGRTALLAAVERDAAGVVEVLLEAGADVDAVDAHGKTALVEAASRGLENVVDQLLRRGAYVDGGRDVTGDTALMSAIRNAPGLREVLDEFCVRGVACKVEYVARRAWDGVRQASGRPAMTKSGIFERHLRIVKKLLDHGAELTVVNASRSTPLTLAATMGHGRMVRLLLEHGADVDATDGGRFDRTALMIAVEIGNSAMTSAILEKHPDLGRRDRVGKSALDLAIEGREDWAVRMLREAGAH